MLTVFGRPNSSNSAKVFWLLEELGLHYGVVPAGTGHGRTDTPEYLAMNPFGKVPVLRDGDVVIWESNAVLRYLATRYGPTPLWPQDAGERSKVDRWMDWVSISLAPPLTRLRKARAAGQTGARDLAAVLNAVSALEHWLAGHAFLAGDAVSLADIVVAAPVYRWSRLPESDASYPVLAAYANRLAENAGYRRHIRDRLN